VTTMDDTPTTLDGCPPWCKDHGREHVLDSPTAHLAEDRETVLSLEGAVEMFLAPDQPAWASATAIREGDTGTTVDIEWHVEHDRQGVTMTLAEARAFALSILSACDEVDPPTDEAKVRDAAGALLAVAEAHGGHYRSPRATEAMQR
jgi:hypothetical protein